MPFVTRRSAFVLAALAVVAAALVAGAVWSGVYDIGADTPHTRPVYALIEQVRERSIEVRAAKLDPPDLADPARIQRGAGNYAHMCASCHRAPGGGDTELSRGLYPAPPDLTKETVEPREAYWVIAHGIKGSGMPAWGRSMDEASMWNLAAFVQQLPTLDAARYAQLVAASGGHHHGSGDAGGADAAPHAHADEAAPHEQAGETPSNEPAGDAPPAATTTHVHADGSLHEHPAAPAPAQPTTHVHADGQVHEHPAEATPPEPAPPAEAHHDEHQHP
jgi:mono/diheme cytochrome c family protein